MCKEYCRRQINAVENIEERIGKMEFQINSDSKDILSPSCLGNLAGQAVSALDNSCSTFTVVSNEVFIKVVSENVDVMGCPDVKPGGCNKDSKPSVGMLAMRISFKGRSTVGKFYLSEKHTWVEALEES